MRFKPVLIAIAFIAAVAFLVWCNREPKPEPVQTAPEAALQNTVNTDSIESLIEAKYRDRETNLIEAHKSELAGIKAKLPKSKDKAVSSVKTYRNTQTPANCDSAVSSLQYYSGELETGLAVADSVMKGQGRIICSQAGTIIRKDSVVQELSAGWGKANIENAGLKKKVDRKNTLLKISGAIITALLAGLALK